jgi:LPS sulfotransferase NodH
MNVQVGLVAAEASSGSTLLHDLAAEQQLLGACLVWPDAVDLTASILEPEHFFEPVHAQIFEWLRDMRSRGQRTSAPLLIAQLGQLGHIDILGLPLSVFVARLRETIADLKRERDDWKLERAGDAARLAQARKPEPERLGLSLRRVLYRR